MSNSTFSAVVFLAFAWLLLPLPLPLDAVLADERLVLDENDDPSEMIEFGRCTIFVFSEIVVENELRSFGAKICYTIIIINATFVISYHHQPFSSCEKLTERSLI